MLVVVLQCQGQWDIVVWFNTGGLLRTLVLSSKVLVPWALTDVGNYFFLGLL